MATALPYVFPLVEDVHYSDTIHSLLYIHEYDTIHTSVVVHVDSVMSFSLFKDCESFYSTLFNWLVGVCAVVLAAFTLYSVIKFFLDREKIKTLEKQVDNMVAKLAKFENINCFHSEHLIQLWLNLGRLMGKNGDAEFEYISYMQVLDILGQNFNEEDYNLVKEAKITERLKKINYGNRLSCESGALDEIKSLENLIKVLDGAKEKNDFLDDLKSLVAMRLNNTPQKKDNLLKRLTKKIKFSFTQLRRK